MGSINNIIARILRITVLLAFLFIPNNVMADVPYNTFSKDNYDRYIYTQPAYKPEAVLGGNLFVPSDEDPKRKVFSPLNQPQDMYINEMDDIYVLDSGNNRIVHLNPTGDLIRVIRVKESPLNQPQGIFVHENGDIYIADTGNKRVIKINEEGQLLKEFNRPESKFLPESFQFDPMKVIVDRRGFLYIVIKGSYQGLMQLDSEGQFHGFFANNKTQASVMDIVKRILYTDKQLSRQERLLPNPITNVDIDETGYIYTTTSGDETEQIKKFNISGDNRLKDLSFGEFFQTKEYRTADLMDVKVDLYGNMTTLDRKYNMVSQYDKLGNLLFLWMGPSQAGTTRLGVIDKVSAIETNSNNELFIMDSSQNLIHKYQPTTFGNMVYIAIRLTQKGNYEDSKSYWQEISRLNANFSQAYQGLGLAAYHQGDYEDAVGYFKLAGDSKGYSDAFWQVRLQWFQQHFAALANTLVLLSLVLLAARKFGFFSRVKNWGKVIYRQKVNIIEQLRFAFYLIKHPLDGFSDLRYANKGGYLSATILLIGIVVSLMIKSLYTGFSFTTVSVDSLKSNTIIIQFLAIFISWVVCNYLISSIYWGEGRFKDVFVGSSYALFPVILLTVPVTLVSNVMTLSESSIYMFFNGLIIIWCGFMFFWNIQVLQNYSVGETVVNIILTIITIVLLWVLIFIVFGLSSEFIRFLNTIYKEVSMR